MEKRLNVKNATAADRYILLQVSRHALTCIGDFPGESPETAVCEYSQMSLSG